MQGPRAALSPTTRHTHALMLQGTRSDGNPGDGGDNCPETSCWMTSCDVQGAGPEILRVDHWKRIVL